MTSKYVVQCRSGPYGELMGDFPGLDWDNAVVRCEAERGKSIWDTVAIRDESTGAIVAAYGGGKALT